jgi:hypothetical protein
MTENEVEIGINRISKLDLSKYKQKMKKTLDSNKK